jgi:hypothetical protein
VFVVCVSRQLVEEDDLIVAACLRQCVSHEFDQAVGEPSLVLLVGDDVSDDSLPEVGIGLSDDGDLAHRRMGEQGGFDLAGTDAVNRRT